MSDIYRPRKAVTDFDLSPTPLQLECERLRDQLAADVAKLQAEITRLGGVCSDYRKTQETMFGDIAAAQAYAAQLREALEVCKKEMQGDKWDALYIDGVLAGK